MTVEASSQALAGQSGSHGTFSARDLGPLDMAAQYKGRTFVIVGGTGFLGKVFWAMLLDRFPDIEHIFLLVRPKGAMDPQTRFDREIATSEMFRPLRERYGSGFSAFLHSKVTPVAGDVTELCCGLDGEVRDKLRGRTDAVINAAGVVEFDPPLDRALEVNAFGVQNLVGLAQDLGGCALYHTSTCFVAGDRTGFVEEVNPLDHPFPKADRLETAHWDAEREISECLDVIDQARHRSNDAFRQSHFLDEAKQRLEQRGAPPYGKNLDDEIEKVRRRYVESRLSEMGTERAQFWGWANTYTYTKSLGEQIVASSGLPFTIGRPAIIESTVSFPFAGWNEGINTSAPLIYAMRSGQPQLPGSDNNLDFIPCDMVAGGMLMSIAELVEGTAPAVYQYGSSDSNPVTTARLFELIGLYKRRFYQTNQRGGAFKSFLQAHYEGSLASAESFEKYGPQAMARGAKKLGDLVGGLATGPARSLLQPVSKQLHSFARTQHNIGGILSQFAPFTAIYNYTFRCDNTRAAYARLSPAEKEAMLWQPEAIDWRRWFLEVHVPGLEKWVFPELEAKLKKKVVAPPRHETLTSLLDDAASRQDLRVVLALATPAGIEKVSYRELRSAAHQCAHRLSQAGVQSGDRVGLLARNHPHWATAFFGILYAGATVVPLDCGADPEAWTAILGASRAKVLLGDEIALESIEAALLGASNEQFTALAGIDRRAIGPMCAVEQRVEQGRSLNPVGGVFVADSADGSAPVRPVVQPQDIAALIYTSGTTGVPKGVMLSHYNLTSLTASLVPLFPLRPSERLLSVLPLHHTFELTCGLLLPLARGSRVVYLDHVNRDRLLSALGEARITALVGVPALWESLERSILARIEERGPVAGKLFEFALTVSRSLGGKVGVDAGRLLFGPVHKSFGGHLRILISGGAALPESTQRLFAGLGLHLSEGYGLTEASPVVSVVRAGPKNRSGHVGKPIPGVEVKISEANGEGVGEVWVKGPNVMVGYADNAEATNAVLDAEGWLHTGDLGVVDHRGNLSIVGRSKEVIVPATGENVFPDDVEGRLGRVAGVEELVVLGVDNGHGKEVVALAATAVEGDDAVQGAERARVALQAACAKLPEYMRPAIVRVLPSALPRTASRKVKRNEVRRLLEQAVALQNARATGDEQAVGAEDRLVISTLALLCRRPESSIHAGQSLRGDLAFDSLMALELLVSLDGRVGGAVDPERVAACQTVGDLQRLVRGAASRISQASKEQPSTASALPVTLPEPVQQLGKRWTHQAQLRFYERVMQTQVVGRAFIPANRNTLVVANHSSHLDMGLVKYALGPYGDDLVALAAQDYFFQGGRYRRGVIENFTNLHPLARTGSLAQSIEQAGQPLAQGKVVLLFPEGTRSVDGSLQPFKPLAAQLVLEHQVDILPMWLDGAHAALPKGASTLRARKLKATIGPPLAVEQLTRLTEGMDRLERVRTIARLMHQAVEGLSKGKPLHLEQLKPTDLAIAVPRNEVDLAGVFSELQSRFLKGTVASPISYYFSLGTERWTIRVSEGECAIQPGKGRSKVDCVLKTSPQIFSRMVRESYAPSTSEFLSGQVKSNNVPALLTFQKVFQLQPKSQ